jgi:D-glucosaminate-6-phosphate ammonia-lyase
MANRFWNKVRQSVSGSTRRDLFRQGGILALAQGLSGVSTRAASLDISSKLYESIGVRPVLNARGTFTIITGSQSLPEVKKAMEEASRHYVQLDELMEGVGKRLAEITKADWGIVTAGCCAALTHFTAAAIAGFNPERMQRLPDLTGLKSEVVIPAYSRNQYDHAIRMLGVKVVEVHDIAELDASLNERTALIYILAGRNDQGPLGTKAISEVAKKKNVPVIVDAAAEILTIPNIHLERGATAVAYSGGKCIRGPQAAGLLLGEKSLLQAAWINSAPHHAFGRSLKVGKEEIMGMLAAVEMWTKRDHKAEWREWEARLESISTRVKQIDGVTTSVVQPNEGLSNRTPTLRVQWDGARLGITGQEAAKLLLDTDPRIVVANASGMRPAAMASALSIVPYMMMPGEDKIVADKLYAVLSKPPKFDNPPTPQGQNASIAGQWDVKLEFGRGSASHTLMLEQDGAKLAGTHRGEFSAGDLAGTVAGNTVRFRSSLPTIGSTVSFDFNGTVDGEKLSGTVNLGEYGQTSWTAQRHQYQTGGRRG